MADIFHDFPVRGPSKAVFRAVSTPEGLNAWWTLTCAGRPASGSEFELGFGPQYQWRAVVTRCIPESEFELQITSADQDWTGSRVSFVLTDKGAATQVRFRHTGWPLENEHYRISNYCWAMYLRLMKRYVESGDVVPYQKRLDA